MNTNLLTILADRLDSLSPDRFNLSYWQDVPSLDSRVVTSEAEFHSCGNTACIAGYAALIKEWQDAGLEMGNLGSVNPMPITTGSVSLTGGYAFAYVSNMHTGLALALTLPLETPNYAPETAASLHSAVSADFRFTYTEQAECYSLQSQLCELVGKSSWLDWTPKDAAQILRHIVALRLSHESNLQGTP